ncbi:MAG: ribosome assembly cofactor RimP [Fluviicola sp.]|jgi:ribosome maturation factor RimP
MITKQLVTKLAEERIAERDEKLFIVDLSISTSNIIRLEIDKTEGNVTIEDCVSVSRNIEHNLDREEVDFELHVSSAGLDKPLRVFQQYVKNVGRGLDIKLKSKEKITGTLVEVSEKGVVLEHEEKQQLDPNKKKKTLVTLRNEVPFSDINEAKIVITFK